MNPSETYFSRNRGEWSWVAEFRVRSWAGLWRSALSFPNKLRVVALMATQLFLGRFSMWTLVHFPAGAGQVNHFTRIRKWGITFLRSEKIFHFQEDGVGLRIEGEESFWPRLAKAYPFSPTKGAVAESATEASYQMPFFGQPSDCRAHLGPPWGEIRLENEWASVKFSLTPAANAELLRRF
jgi:hypothetical protein